MFRLLVRMTHISWIVTTLLLSLIVGLTVGCSKFTNGNWLKRMGDVRNEDGYWGKRSQGQRLSQMADLSNSRRVRNRRNQGNSEENAFESDYSSVSSSVDENAINPEPPDIILTPEEKDEQMFQLVDLDGNGLVSKTEYRLANPGMDDVAIHHVFLSFDAHMPRDGFISLAEFREQRNIFRPDPRIEEQQPDIPQPKNNKECTQRLMEVCDSQFINSTQAARGDPSTGNICNSFQVYVDCLARESQLCQAVDFTEKILSIASGLRDEGACPDLDLPPIRYPGLVSAVLEANRNVGTDQQHQNSGRGRHREQEGERRSPQLVDIFAEAPSPMYGSGSKQQEDTYMDEFRYGQQFDMFGDLMLADEETGIGSSSPSAYIEDSKVVKSNHDRKNVHNTNRDRTGSRDNTKLYDVEVTTPLVEELPQLPQYEEEREHLKSDNTQTVTSSYTTPKHRHRHHHTSRTQSSEHLQSLHLRHVRSTTTKKSHIQKSRNRSRSNCSVSTIWPCNEAFIMALAQGEEDPCESLVRFRHCVHKSSRHCMDTNVYKIREGLKYLSKEHRRAKLCRQITL